MASTPRNPHISASPHRGHNSFSSTCVAARPKMHNRARDHQLIQQRTHLFSSLLSSQLPALHSAPIDMWGVTQIQSIPIPSVNKNSEMHGYRDTVRAHLCRKRDQTFVELLRGSRQAMLVAFTCHVTECSRHPCKVGILKQYFIDTLISSNGDTTIHTEMLWWGFTSMHGAQGPHSA